MGAGHNSFSTSQPLRRTGLIKRCCLGVEFHVSWIDTRPKDPRVVEVALTSLNQQNLEIMVQICQTVLVSFIALIIYQPRASAGTYRPATTQPQLPPPATMMSNSSGKELPFPEYCVVIMVDLLSDYVNCSSRGCDTVERMVREQ